MSTDATWDFDSPDKIDTWLEMLDAFFRESQSADEDGQFRAIEARAWRSLLSELKVALEDLASGDATIDDVNAILQQVKDFDAPYLSEIGDWNDYFETILSDIADAEETYATNTGFADYANEVGEGVANTAKGLYDELKDKITGCVGSPLDCIKQIGTAILDAGGIPQECQEMNDPFFCTENGPDEGGKACWKDCVNFNLPGLPIPDIPLPPGVVDIGTYRDFENAVKTVGKTIGDIIDGNASCGPDGDQNCTVGQVLEDLGDWAREKWEDAIGGIDDATGDDVLDWLKGILGPVLAGMIYGEIEEEVTRVLTPLTEETKDCTDGSGEVYATVGIDEECPPVPCGEGEKDFGNGCEPICEYDETISASDPQCVRPVSEVEEQCNAQGKVYDELNDECKEECKNAEYVIGADGNCGPPEEEEQTCNNGATNYPDCDECPTGYKYDSNTRECVEDTGGPDDGTGPDCNSPRPGYNPAIDWRKAQAEWDAACRSTNCPQDGSLITDHIDNDCDQGLISDEVLSDDELCNGPRPPQTQNDKTYCYEQGYAPCPEGTEEYGNGRWYKAEDCTPIAITECDNGATVESECNQCPGNKTIPEWHVDGDCRKPVTYAGEPCGDNGEVYQDDGSCAAPEAESCEDQGLVTDPNDGACLTQEQFCARYPDDESCVGPEEPEETCDDPQYAADNPLECGGDPEGPQEGNPCDSTGDGVNDGTIVNGECVATPEEECAKPDGTPTGATVSSGCEQCPDGYTFDFDGICQPDGGSINCEEYNRETLDDGTCGGCLPGFQKDTSLPNEPCVQIFDGCPAGYELVNGECLAIECPEGQVYCVDTGQCEYPNQCPSTADDGSSSGGGGGGGGGFGIDLEIDNLGIGGDPQLLGRNRYGAQDFLTPLFAEVRTGGGSDFPIARFLQGQRKKDNFS